MADQLVLSEGGDGVLTPEELEAVLHSLGLSMTGGKSQEVINHVHANSTGTVDFSALSTIMAHKVDDVDFDKMKELVAIYKDRGDSGDDESRHLVADPDKSTLELRPSSLDGTMFSSMGDIAVAPGSVFLDTGDAADVWRLNHVQGEVKPKTSASIAFYEWEPKIENSDYSARLQNELMAKPEATMESPHGLNSTTPMLSGFTPPETPAYVPNFVPMDLFEK
ncbi:hypothetical protein FRC11_004505 [Ceratobasidium sp. 423]|nr:hypothetical protein FRC11_004505 [Ceratobasidium sp. 423]